MKYAYVDGQRTEPAPKKRGLCPGCRESVTSKCGQHVLWHWAHLRKTHCDKWWEAETKWHRDWKNRFPLEWQEIPLKDPATQELHVADVRTAHGLVIEFQRSTIAPEEVAAREAFYKKMVWLIDGCRSDNDPIYFSLGLGEVSQDGLANFTAIGRSKLFHRWHTIKPVFIDFGDKGFWRVLHFNPATKNGLAAYLTRENFVDLVVNGKTDFSKNGGPATPLPFDAG